MRVLIQAGFDGRRADGRNGAISPALVQIGGQPLLWHSLKYLDYFGPHQFIVVTEPKDTGVRQYVCDSLLAKEVESESPLRPFDVSAAEPAWQVDLLETAEHTHDGMCLKCLGPRLENGPFLMVRADRLANVDLPKLKQFHQQHGRLATMVTVQPDLGFPRVETAGAQVVRYHQQDRLGEQFWIDGGYFLLEPGALEYISNDHEAWNEGPLERLAEAGQLMAYRHKGFWQCVETTEDAERLERLWHNDSAPWKVWGHELNETGCSTPDGNPKGRVLVTGHEGYLGCVISRVLSDGGYAVSGLDAQLYAKETETASASVVSATRMDVRDISVEFLRGFDAVVHLAGLSDDDLGSIVPEMTYDINYRGTVSLAEKAKEAGVSRFLFPASCSIYDAVSDGWLTEQSRLNPVTPYSIAIALAEAELARLADDCFSPTCLRLAAAYGVSPNFRTDLIYNRLVGQAFTAGCLSTEDAASQWRPAIHVQDIARAFRATLDAPRRLVHNQIFNVGSTSENYRQQDVLRLLQRMLPGLRCDGLSEEPSVIADYRVSFEKLRRTLPDFQPRWTLPRGLRQLIQHYRELRITKDELDHGPHHRQQQLERLIQQGQLSPDLRWQAKQAPHRRIAA